MSLILLPALTHLHYGFRWPFGSGFVVGWGTLALINAGLAQAKRRSGLAWFLVSLLVGPLATLALVVFYADAAKG